MPAPVIILSILTLFIAAVIGMGFMNPIANASHAQDANGATINNSNITGVNAQLTYLTVTVAGAFIVMMFLGAI